MKIKYVGHACFLITSDGGTRIITDPYESGSYDGAVKYRAVKDEADLVLVSHGHPDHNDPGSVPGSPAVIDTAGEHRFGDIDILGIEVYHDTEKGAERGENIIFRMNVDGLNIVHSGDLGHTLDPGAVAAIGAVDILLLPVGGFFTVGSEEADDIIGALKPGLVIPMHFKTAGVDFPIAPVENFLEGRSDINRLAGSEVEIDPASPPVGIMVMEPAALP